MSTLSNFIHHTRCATQHRFFDATKQEDMDEYGYFVRNGKWKTSCPFLLEQPYLSIPHMINEKIVQHMFGAK